MSAVPEDLELARGFPTATAHAWRSLVSDVLSRSGDGGDPVEALSHRNYDGIRLRPLYTAADTPAENAPPGATPFTRGATRSGATTTGWDVRQRHANPDPARTREAVLADLAGGATSLWLVVGEGGIAVDDLADALDGVHLDLAPIALDAGPSTLDAATALLTLGERKGVAGAELAGTLGADPIGTRARTGAPADIGLLLTLSEQSKSLRKLCVATVDATVYHEAGAGDAVEVAIATSVGVAYLRALTDGGLSVDDALDVIEFRFAVTAEQFASIAKLRAARRIWGRVAELSGASGSRRGQRQHAVTSAAMMTKRDPWVNLLRTTIACFAAAVGGAGAVTVLPFDSAIGLSDDFARRIARNTHTVLHDESSLARVIDPAGGSWYVETFTDAIAEVAWEKFTSIERAGGALSALDDGTLSELIAVGRDARADDIGHRRAPIIGVSEFAFPDEPAVIRAEAPVRAGGGPLETHRWAEPFEALRERAEAADPRPSVFLATLGPVAAHGARLSFATNLFQAAGVRVVTGTPDEFASSGATVACLCSSDKVYADQAEAAIETMAPARYLWLAGQGEYEGVDGCVYAGCDAVAVLRTTLDASGVAR